ncbi:putative oxidoreductase [Devosia sp. LC5]|uniref:Gfo/Idh/MocA family protein n=1 Tax=Devosia sp. LC5 TaxID=1502724 RepID=UPI0004E327B4|nr:Gfo/Idh/MocA family oxidoreductase [Devosia sp. LC5]KFC67371.1 putative oxidoreductase [Devosia sp. LC5]
MITTPANIAIAGCGAVSTLYYAPALAILQQKGRIGRITAFDPNAAQAHAFAGLVGGTEVSQTFDDLLALPADLLIVASPPMAHADQVIATLNAGKHVLCEKPLAIGSAQARQMIEASVRNNRLLFVGHVRRQFPATNAIRDIVRSGLLGQISAVTCFEGGPFSWPISGSGYFSRASSGGGVLQDIGTHCLDLLIWWLGEPDTIAYEDDAFGGVEANCLVTLDYPGFQAKIRLSRDWAQPNIYRIVGAGGWLEWPVNDARNFRFALSGGDTADTQMRAPQGDDFHQAFARQIEAALDGSRNAVSAADILPAIALIETCYANRAAMTLPWLGPGERARARALSRPS